MYFVNYFMSFYYFLCVYPSQCRVLFLSPKSYICVAMRRDTMMLLHRSTNKTKIMSMPLRCVTANIFYGFFFLSLSMRSSSTLRVEISILNSEMKNARATNKENHISISANKYVHITEEESTTHLSI